MITNYKFKKKKSDPNSSLEIRQRKPRQLNQENLKIIVLIKVKCDEFKIDLINNFESTTNKLKKIITIVANNGH